jgi:hypothetical protein
MSNNRHQRRAEKSQNRADRIAAFRQKAGKGGFETSLCAVGEHRPQDGRAINNWLLSEPTAKPTCFSCRAQFSPARRPGGFLTATATRAGPKAGVAVAGCCAECWSNKSADEIEQAALALLRKQLGAGRVVDDDS